MIDAKEIRLGNYIMQKILNRIVTVPCAFQHFTQMERGESANFFPVVLKAEVLEKCGFTENKDYPLLPAAREFILVMAVNGSNKNQLNGYVKNNGECFARATVDGAPASNNIYHLHQLQNLYFSITGEELNPNIKK